MPQERLVIVLAILLVRLFALLSAISAYPLAHTDCDWAVGFVEVGAGHYRASFGSFVGVIGVPP